MYKHSFNLLWLALEFFHFTMAYIQKTKIMASGPITSWQVDGETMETVTDFIFLGSKIIAAMKFKDACSLEEKL